MYLEDGKKVTEDFVHRSQQLREELRRKGRLGWEWFLSREEFLTWRAATLTEPPIDEWL